MGPTWLNGLLLLFKKAEIDSARESYSSSPPLEDCILPLLPESIFLQEKERETKRERRKRKTEIWRERDVSIYAVRFLRAYLLTYPHRLDQAHLRRGEKLQNKACGNIKEESEKSSGR